MKDCKLWLALAAAVLGCTPQRGKHTYDEPHRVSTGQEAGTAHVAVVSIARWEDYVGHVQPTFQLTEAEALEKALPKTRGMEERFLDAIYAKLLAAIEKVEPDGEGAELAGSGGPDSKRAEERMPGTKQKYRDPKEVDAIKSPQAPETVETDPVLRYLAATALYQEIQLLNRYVRDAALREGYIPYVVRLQVSLMPYARNQPYDTYTNISFFSTFNGNAANAFIPMGEGETASAARDAPLTLGDTKKKRAAPTPHVVPLLVTDNLEATTRSRALSTLRQYAGAITFLRKSLGASAEVARQREEFASLTGSELNSLLTVGRLSDNTLRVRLGAAQGIGTEYVMVPRTHTVTVLVMVPADAPPKVSLFARTSFRDAKTGGELVPRTRSQVLSMLRQVNSDYELNATDDVLWRLLAFAQGNDQAAFFGEVAKSLGESADPYGQALWSDLIGLAVGSRYSSSVIDLPGHGTATLFGSLPPEQAAVLVDDGCECRATLHGGRHLGAEWLSAFVELDRKDLRGLRIHATKIQCRENGTVELVLPSVKGLDCAAISIVLECRSGENRRYEGILRAQTTSKGTSGK